MNNHLLAPFLLTLLFGANTAVAANGKVTISAPADGATVVAGKKLDLSYEADPGYEGDHLHLNVDGMRVDVLRELKGKVEIDALAPGKHQLCIAVNTRGHVPTGTETCITVMAK